MSDRELLELAALVLGKETKGDVFKHGYNFLVVDNTGMFASGLRIWNPIAKNVFGLADCLQMEIDLGLDVVKSSEEWHVSKSMGRFKYCTGSHQDRQRASTMAAAAIGKQMKDADSVRCD